jgi:conjugal transfer pilus assembly protein TraV
VSRARYPHAVALGSLVLLGACTTLGGHVSGQFSCRAPQGDCAPTSVIDARATGASATFAAPASSSPVQRVGSIAQPGDLARTAEHMLKIVFPAHVNTAGVFRAEAVAWAIAEPADWAARLRRRPVDASPRALGRTITERLKSAPAFDASAGDRSADEPSLHPAAEPSAEAASSADTYPVLPLASPGLFPPTLGEAVAGATAPEIEGLDAAAPGARTPRSAAQQSLVFPSVEAIDAAHARARRKDQGEAARPIASNRAKEAN